MPPDVHPSCYIAPTAVIIGDVTLESGVSVWDYAVLRGDLNRIHIGKGTNVQDGVLMHVAHEDPVIVGHNVSIGHGAILHGTTIEDDVIIGMNATVLDKTVVGTGSIIGAHAVVSPRSVIPAGSMALGVPARVVKNDLEAFRDMARQNAQEYHILRKAHSDGKYVRYDVS